MAGYLRLAENAVEIWLGGHRLLVIGLDDLIRLKREAWRDKDLRDIAALTEVQRARREEDEGSGEERGG